MRFRTSRSPRRSGAAGLLGGRGGSLKMRLIIGAAIAAFALFSYFTASDTNPVTGESQRLSLEEDQEIALGLQSMDQMAQQFGGPSGNTRGQRALEEIGARLVAAIPSVYDGASEIPWEFSFTLLDDDQTVNAFALPGGPTFMTDALFDKLETPDEVAGVMGHEIVHVIQRHGAQRMHEQNLWQGLSGAATTAAGDYTAGQITGFLGNFLGMKYGREQEIESDVEGVRIMAAAGFDPTAMIRVMEVLEAASGGAGGPEWASSHPDPGNRTQRIEEEIEKMGLGGAGGER